MNRAYDLIYVVSKMLFLFLILSLIMVASLFFLLVPVMLFVKFYYGEKYVFNVSIKKSVGKRIIIMSLLSGILIDFLIVSFIFTLFFSQTILLLLFRFLLLIIGSFILYCVVTIYTNEVVKNNYLAFKECYFLIFSELKYSIVSFLMSCSLSILLFIFLDIFFISYMSVMIYLEYQFYKVCKN